MFIVTNENQFLGRRFSVKKNFNTNQIFQQTTYIEQQRKLIIFITVETNL